MSTIRVKSIIHNGDYWLVPTPSNPEDDVFNSIVLGAYLGFASLLEKRYVPSRIGRWFG